jgi:hypothetical protein
MHCKWQKLPEHYQLPTDATTVDRMQIPVDFIADMHDTTFEQFPGSNQVDRYPNTYGINEKGGMNKEEFRNYMLNSLRRCFPDSADTAGKRVCVLVDGGPGRTNEDMLERLRLLGIHLFSSGPPNTTHFMQIEDMLFGGLKTGFVRNLDALFEWRLTEYGPQASIGKNDIGILAYGGRKRCEPEAPELKNAIASAFSRECIQRAWGEKLGVFPIFNRAVLTNKKIRHENTAGDPMATYLQDLSSQNKLASDILDAAGYNGSLLCLELKSRTSRTSTDQITVPHTRERQDAILNSKTQGQFFAKTGGSTLTGNDFFIAAERGRLNEQVQAMKTDKKEQEAAVKRESIAFAIIQAEKNNHTISSVALYSL